MKTGSSRRIANNLVALSSAAVLTVYAAGYMKTRAAAQRLEHAGHRETADPPALHAPAPAPDAASRPLPSEILPAPAASPAPAVEPKAPAATAPAIRAEHAQHAHHQEHPEHVEHAQPAPAAATTAAEPAATPTAAPAAAPSPAVTPPAASADAEPKPAEPPAPKASPYKDGTYYGWGTSRHGSIEATVTIAGGKIVASAISQCLTRYSCSWIAHLVPQVVTRQSADVDYVSGATQSTYAFYDAVVEALSKAK
jgi:uncharacterized protein with FMN-binding domain